MKTVEEKYAFALSAIASILALQNCNTDEYKIAYTAFNMLEDKK